MYWAVLATRLVDGRYRFDRLAAGTYRVKAMLGSNPMQGMSFVSAQVTILAEETASLDLELVGGATLTVSMVAGGEINFARISTLPGNVASMSARELESVAGKGTGYEGFSLSIAGRPAEIKNLPPGSYSVCAIVFPNQVKGMGETMEYMKREGDNLMAQCQAVTITEEPQQRLELRVVVPDFVPDPTPGADEDTE